MEKEAKSSSQSYKGITRYFIPVDFPLEVDFYALRSHVQTLDKLPNKYNTAENSEKKKNN